jgi:hypothetical protein
MAKTQITKVQPQSGPVAMQMPDYLQGLEPAGTEALQSFITPPRLKVIQKTASSELLLKFREGDVIVLPDNLLFAEMVRENDRQPKAEWTGTPFLFTPVFFYPEWVTWNPIQMKGTLPSIRGRTIDPKSQIAMKARNRDMWLEVCPENTQYKMRHTEHLNFLIALHTGPYAGTGISMTFAKGSHFAGTRLCNLIKMRKAPIYACVFEARSVFQQNQQGDWFQISVDNPAQDASAPWVTQEQLESFKKLHEELKASHDKLLVDYGDTDEDIIDVPAESKEY